jgi:hypothetical protein
MAGAFCMTHYTNYWIVIGTLAVVWYCDDPLPAVPVTTIDDDLYIRQIQSEFEYATILVRVQAGEIHFVRLASLRLPDDRPALLGTGMKLITGSSKFETLHVK